MQSMRNARGSAVRQLLGLRGKSAQALFLVADNHRAMLFHSRTPHGRLEKGIELLHEQGRSPGHELTCDRPGRTVDSWTASGAAPRGCNARHGYGGESQDPKEHESLCWAEQVAHWAEQRIDSNDSREFVLVAEPRFLGKLRRALPEHLRKRVSATHARDFAKLDGADLIERLERLE